MKRHYVSCFDGGHGRQGLIWAEVAKCSACGREVPCIGMDSSEDEYKPGYACLTCIVKGLCRPEIHQRCTWCGHAEADHDGYGGLCDGDMGLDTRSMCGCPQYEGPPAP